METKLTYTFTIKIDDKTYNFNVVANDKEQALAILKVDLEACISEIITFLV